MTNYVIINGVNSNTINGLGINELPPITKPSMRVLTEEIDGRDGDITTNLGYSAYDKTITIGLFGTGYDIDDIVAFFNEEGTIVFSNEADKYYNFKIVNQIDYVALQKFKSANVTFHCQPFKYPLEETPIEIDYDYIEEQDVESATLNTAKATIQVNLLGNTSQYTTTGKNLLHQDQYISTTTRNGITFTNNGDGTFSITGTATANTNIVILSGASQIGLESGKTYYLYSSQPYNNQTFNVSIPFKQDGTQKYLTANASLTTSGELTNITLAFYIDSGNTINAQNVKLMLVEGSTAGDYEPYTGGASPNPSYPQDIHIVSGDNTIVSTGKNLANTKITNWSYLGVSVSYDETTQVLTINGTSTGNTQVSFQNYNFSPISVSNGERINLVVEYISGSATSTDNARITLSDINYTMSALISLNGINTSKIEYKNISTNLTYDKLNFVYRTGDVYNNLKIKIMVCKGTDTTYEPYTSTSYPIHLGTYELCKISTYQDRFIKTTGKNLFDNITENKLITSDGTISNNASWNLGDYIKVQPNTKYTFSRYDGTGQSLMIAEYNPSKTFIQRDTQGGIGVITPYTITTTATTEYVRLNYDNTKGNTLLQFELGETATSYEPYGTNEWYLEKKIGKVVLDGTQDIPLASGTPRRFNATYTALGLDNVKSGSSTLETQNNYRMCDHFYYASGVNTWGVYYLHNNWLVMLDSESVIVDANALKTWFQNNNTSIYYVLNTPTYTQITGTLKDELNALQKAQSYKGTTNINQINNDLPFKMNLKAIEDGSNEGIVNNIGNTYAKPIIELEGTGEINIYLNDVQMLKAILTDKMTIDIAKMEAYNPDTSVLLNRQLIGDISKFLLPSGESTIRIDGNLTKATISNYTRWL